jgi:phosphoenolpyruvate-protein kinase (PTS system EI component)
MFVIAASTPANISSIQKKFKKYGKKMKKQRVNDFTNIREKLSEIAEGEKARSREILESHKAFFVEEKKPKEEVSIDFYEK